MFKCSYGTPAIWKYKLAEHFRAVHNLVAPDLWPAECTIGGGEAAALLKIWKKRSKIPQPRQTGKSREPLEISEQHSSRLAFRLGFFLLAIVGILKIICLIFASGYWLPLMGSDLWADWWLYTVEKARWHVQPPICPQN
ncbi:hypothetical protein C8J57DRAFT_1213415 [Mycena rebaudengoi]|nr:hypothetical protein C8J57DRAFT_1213415 [Mycena rebaudengoi]